MKQEDICQQEIFELLGCLAPSVVAFAIPNASRRTKGGRASNAVPGLRPGVWDVGMILPLDCLYPGRTAYCEVKVPPNGLSDAQAEFGAILLARGIPHFIVRTPTHLDTVRFMLGLWRVPTREARATPKALGVFGERVAG